METANSKKTLREQYLEKFASKREVRASKFLPPAKDEAERAVRIAKLAPEIRADIRRRQKTFQKAGMKVCPSGCSIVVFNIFGTPGWLSRVLSAEQLEALLDKSKQPAYEYRADGEEQKRA